MQLIIVIAFFLNICRTVEITTPILFSLSTNETKINTRENIELLKWYATYVQNRMYSQRVLIYKNHMISLCCFFVAPIFRSHLFVFCFK